MPPSQFACPGLAGFNLTSSSPIRYIIFFVSRIKLWKSLHPVQTFLRPRRTRFRGTYRITVRSCSSTGRFRRVIEAGSPFPACRLASLPLFCSDSLRHSHLHGSCATNEQDLVGRGRSFSCNRRGNRKHRKLKHVHVPLHLLTNVDDAAERDVEIHLTTRRCKCRTYSDAKIVACAMNIGSRLDITLLPILTPGRQVLAHGAPRCMRDLFRRSNLLRKNGVGIEIWIC